ncbi:MAG: cytochrome c [Chloroflexota bacterium]
MKNSLIRFTQWLVIAVIGMGSIVIMGGILGENAAHALPEFVDRTGEPCATCHVNPGGGGPRTLRGLLWSAQGRPEEVPVLGNILVAPGINDGIELYDIACASCHGAAGEGLFGVSLVGSGIEENKIKSNILRGRERSGMPAFEGQFTAIQLDTLVAYVTGIASGEFDPAPASYPLDPGKLVCSNYPENIKCGGN